MLYDLASSDAYDTVLFQPYMGSYLELGIIRLLICVPENQLIREITFWHDFLGEKLHYFVSCL